MTENKGGLVKIDGNICEYPFFTLSKSEGTSEIKEYIFRPIVIEKGEIVERKLTLESLKGHGLPTAFDMDVLMAISHIGTETKAMTGEVHFSFYEICKKLGIPNKESKIKKSILKMYYVDCRSEYCVLVKNKEENKKEYISGEDYFHIFDCVGFIDIKKENKRKSKYFTYVQFSKYFVQNFLAGYFQYIDFSLYMALGTPTAKRLYVYLSKKKFGKSFFKISIEKLASVIPIEAGRLSKVREILKESCERLIEQKFINGYSLEKGAMDITFYFPLQELKEPEAALEENEENEVYDALVKFGVSKSAARNLIENYDEERITNQISWMKYRGANDGAAFLVSAIKADWGPPKEFLEEAKKNEEKKAKTDAGQRVKNAKYIIFPSGERYKISRVFPEAVEYFIYGRQKCVVMLNLAQDCQFE